MQFLLDTHALLWALTEPDKLGPTARALIEDPESGLLVSAASAWEISTKRRLGKLPQSDALVAGFGRHLTRLGVRTLEVTTEHGLLAGSLEWSHRDPFDRMLAAQCMFEALPLITKDSAFDDLAGVRTLWR